MDYSALTTSLLNSLGAHLPNIFGALGILIVGWIIAVARARRHEAPAERCLSVNRRIKESTDQSLDVENGIAIGVFWVVLLVTFLGMFNALRPGARSPTRSRCWRTRSSATCRG